MTGALSSINGAARLTNEASPTPTNLKGHHPYYGSQSSLRKKAMIEKFNL